MKLVKRILVSFLTVLCLVATLGVFAACEDTPENNGNNNNGEQTQNQFVIILQYEDGTGVQGAEVQLCATTCTIITDMANGTGADGKAVASFDELTENEYSVGVHFLPEGYEIETNADGYYVQKITKANPTMTIIVRPVA